MITATSGAQLHELDEHYVIKVGAPGRIGDRVGEQARWLQAHTSPALPRVYAAWHNGYVMERLDLPSWQDVTAWDHLLIRVLETLRSHVWAHEPEVPVDWARHARFIRERCELAAPEAAKPLERWLEAIVDTPLKQCLIHGDPTFDNLALRDLDEGFELVFIDPNPARAEVPSLEACDLANVLQSLHGYEHLKYGRPMPECGPTFVRGYLGYDERRWHAVEYFTAAKYARLLAYESDLRPVFRDVLHQLLKDGGYL